MDYFKYEDKINEEHLRKMSGEKTLKICFSLINYALKVLRSSMISGKRHISGYALKREIKKVLWSK